MSDLPSGYTSTHQDWFGERPYEPNKFIAKLRIGRDLAVTAALSVAATALGGLYGWRYAYGDSNEEYAIQFGLLGAVVITCLLMVGYLVIREMHGFWWLCGFLLLVPFAAAPIVLAVHVMDQAVEDRGVTETCIVVGAEEYVEEAQRYTYDRVDLLLDCPTGLHHYDVAAEDRVVVDDTIQRTYDPTARVEAEYGPPQDHSVMRGIVWAGGLIAGGLLLRWGYLAWRVRYERWKRDLPGAVEPPQSTGG